MLIFLKSNNLFAALTMVIYYRKYMPQYANTNSFGYHSSHVLIWVVCYILCADIAVCFTQITLPPLRLSSACQHHNT